MEALYHSGLYTLLLLCPILTEGIQEEEDCQSLNRLHFDCEMFLGKNQFMNKVNPYASRQRLVNCLPIDGKSQEKCYFMAP